MELRHYWSIIARRIWIVAALLAVVVLTYMFSRPSQQTVYSTGMRFVIGIRPEARQGDYYTFDRYYTWLTAEYLVDDLSEVIKSRAFAADVAERTGLPIAPGPIQAATSAGKLHRVLNVSITWHNAQELEAMANAVADILVTDAGRYFAQLGTEAAVVSMIDGPTISVIGPSLRARLDLPLRLLLTIAAGIGLAFLLDYLDGSIRHRADLDSLGLPVLGQVPAPRRWQAFLPMRRPIR